MYLAPLNYDRFFKKVFSHTHIAKAFLEDFLGEKIEEIELLERTHLLTNSAMKIEVDFRCKIKGSYIIIDMQQWYKPDVVKRFYLYHCASTALQLETLPEKIQPTKKEDKRAKDKDYTAVEPVLTLIWMVSDSLEFTDNFITYTTAPEMSLDFIGNTELWDRQDIKELSEVREVVLKTLNATHKDLDFLRKNRLIFMFQHNIVKDEKFSPYRKWFEFAEKTRNRNNRAADFTSYKKEKIFKEMMRTLLKKGMNESDLEYLLNEDEVLEMVERTLEGARKEGRKEGRQMGIEEGKQMGIEEERNTTIFKLYLKGKSAEEIADLLDISAQTAQIVINNYEKK